MPLPSLDEYRKQREEDQLDRARDERRHLQIMHRAAVQANLLTGHEHWDTFLSYIQSAIEATEAQRAVFLEKVSDPSVVDDNETRRIRNAIIACNERIGAWKGVLQLPKALLEQGEKAKSLLDRMEDVG